VWIQSSGVHHPLEHIPRLARSHWMLPSGNCLGHIAPAAAIVDEDFGKKHKTF